MDAALIVFSALAFVAFLVWNSTRSNLDRRRLELDAQTRMLEKIGPGQALTDFLQTHEGKQFFDRLTAPASAWGKDTRTRVLVLVTLGLIALFAGVFVVMGVAIPTVVAGGPGATAGVRLMSVLPVFVLSGAGVGALLAAWLMHRSSKK